VGIVASLALSPGARCKAGTVWGLGMDLGWVFGAWLAIAGFALGLAQILLWRARRAVNETARSVKVS
jgi:hypothetical protein